jgi:hypothetical protein
MRGKKMSYDRIGNCQVRSNGKKVNIFDKVLEIKKDLSEILPEIEGDKLIALFSRVRTYYANKRKGVYIGRSNKGILRPLTEIEEILYGYLIQKGLNPATTYRWFTATRLPSDIRIQLSKGQVSYKIAMQISANRRKTKQSADGLILMEEVRNIVQKIDWR